MGMFDHVIVPDGFMFEGKTYKEFQTKDLDRLLRTIEFGKEITEGLIPVSHEFIFYGFSVEDEEKYEIILREAKEKYKPKENSENEKIYFEIIRDADPRELVEFIGTIDHKNTFCMVLSKDRKTVLKKMDQKDQNEILRGWDNEKVYFTFEGKEYCVNDYPVLMDILTHECRSWLGRKDE